MDAATRTVQSEYVKVVNMKTKYDVGDIVKIGFKIKSIEITANHISYSLESENRYLGGTIKLNFVSEEEIDNEIDNEN